MVALLPPATSSGIGVSSDRRVMPLTPLLRPPVVETPRVRALSTLYTPLERVLALKSETAPLTMSLEAVTTALGVCAGKRAAEAEVVDVEEAVAVLLV